MPGYERYDDESPPHVLGGPAARSHEKLGRSNAITFHKEMSLKSVLTDTEFRHSGDVAAGVPLFGRIDSGRIDFKPGANPSTTLFMIPLRTLGCTID